MTEEGKKDIRMVDIGSKEETLRVAVAKGEIKMARATLDLILAGEMKKGDPLAVAQVAGVMAAKKTSEMIPLCHPLSISGAKVEFAIDKERSLIEITASVKCKGQTGVEMEALSAVSLAALTIYDMSKWVDKSMEISNIRLIKKTGGASGNHQAEQEGHQ